MTEPSVAGEGRVRAYDRNAAFLDLESRSLTDPLVRAAFMSYRNGAWSDFEAFLFYLCQVLADQRLELQGKLFEAVSLMYPAKAAAFRAKQGTITTEGGS